MSLKRLNTYLAKMKSGEDIHYPKFWAYLNTLNLPMSLQPQMLDAKKVKGEYYKIKSVSAELDSALEQLATTQTHDRSVLATQNMSHRKSVRGSMLVVRQNDHHPTVVLFNDASEYTPSFFY